MVFQVAQSHLSHYFNSNNLNVSKSLKRSSCSNHSKRLDVFKLARIIKLLRHSSTWLGSNDLIWVQFSLNFWTTWTAVVLTLLLRVSYNAEVSCFSLLLTKKTIQLFTLLILFIFITVPVSVSTENFCAIPLCHIRQGWQPAARGPFPDLPALLSRRKTTPFIHIWLLHSKQTHGALAPT